MYQVCSGCIPLMLHTYVYIYVYSSEYSHRYIIDLCAVERISSDCYRFTVSAWLTHARRDDMWVRSGRRPVKLTAQMRRKKTKPFQKKADRFLFI